MSSRKTLRSWRQWPGVVFIERHRNDSINGSFKLSKHCSVPSSSKWPGRWRWPRQTGLSFLVATKSFKLLQCLLVCFCLHVCRDLHCMLSRLQPWVLIPAAPGLDGTSADSSVPEDPYLAWFAQPATSMRSLIVVGIWVVVVVCVPTLF